MSVRNKRIFTALNSDTITLILVPGCGRGKTEQHYMLCHRCCEHRALLLALLFKKSLQLVTFPAEKVPNDIYPISKALNSSQLVPSFAKHRVL